MSFEEISLAASEGMLTLIKLGVLFGLLMYLGFSIVIIRQVQLMTKTVAGELDRQVKALSWGHFILSAVIFMFVLFFL